MKTTLMNLTPHDLVLRDESGTDHVLQPSGIVARVGSIPGVKLGAHHGNGYADCPVPVYGPAAIGTVESLPDPVEGTIYVVSRMVLSACGHERPDVVAPGTGPNEEAARNQAGYLVAVTRLVRG